ncbi:hypothetical protein [Oligoflexus tunisiensis]|uniref:hypothetical protein n=1 Tax=Oligoflexus tunisiensis TaxID=708132 RepID=UPI00114CCBC6|nr:hypothetical protein [Oligoflexus tunisiensis]
MNDQKHHISKGDLVEINGRRGVVCHVTSQRCWVLHDEDRVATGYSMARIRRSFLRFGIYEDQLVKAFTA